MSILVRLLSVAFVTSLVSASLFAEENTKVISISNGVKSVDINLNGEKFTLMRSQKIGNKISSLYETTHRGMPQPMVIAKGVETIGELEFISYMKQAQKNESIIIIDSRTPGWHDRLRIPGSVNIPYTNFNNKEDAKEAMEDDLGVVVNKDETLDFSKAKTIVLYCNGYWCGQTPTMITRADFSLLKMGYPTSKIKYYRGGMQAWTSLGFTVAGTSK